MLAPLYLWGEIWNFHFSGGAEKNPHIRQIDIKLDPRGGASSRLLLLLSDLILHK